jgi:hypothetical protein
MTRCMQFCIEVSKNANIRDPDLAKNIFFDYFSAAAREKLPLPKAELVGIVANKNKVPSQF